MIKVLVFDLDGTIIDSDKVIVESWKEVFKIFKPEENVSESLLKTFSGPPLKVTISKYFPNNDYDLIYREYRKRSVKYYEKYLKVFPKSIEILNNLKRDGYKLAVLTSKVKNSALLSFKLVNLDINLFDYFVFGDDKIAPKPSPDGLLKIMEYFNVNNDEIINIGDTEYDYYCGKNANVKTIMLKLSPRTYESKIFPLSFCYTYNELYEVIKHYGN